MPNFLFLARIGPGEDKARRLVDVEGETPAAAGATAERFLVARYPQEQEFHLLFIGLTEETFLWHVLDPERGWIGRFADLRRPGRPPDGEGP